LYNTSWRIILGGIFKLKKKILSILLIVFLLTGVLITLTACGDENKKVSSEDTIKKYFEAVNQRDFTKISELYNISGMNEYSVKFLESEFEVTDKFLKSNWEQYFEVMKKFDVSLTVKGIYKITDRTSVEEMYEKINEDLIEDEQFAGEDADSTWDALKDMAAAYNLYYVRLTRVDKDETKETSTMLILDDNGKIVNDSAMYYVLSVYAYKK